MARIRITTLIDEEDLLKDFLKNKKTVNNKEDMKKRLGVFVKYLKKEKGLSKNEIINEVHNLLDTYLVGYVYKNWDGKVTEIVNKNIKKENLEYKKAKTGVHINYEELEYIKAQDDIETEKLLFVMLVLAKLENEKDKPLRISNSNQTLLALSKFKYKTKSDSKEVQARSFFYDIGKRGYVNYRNGKSNYIFLNYGDKDNIKEGIDLELNRENIENVVVTYLDWRQKEDYYYCKVCGKEIKKGKTKTPKYCVTCAKKVNIEKTKNRQKTE